MRAEVAETVPGNSACQSVCASLVISQHWVFECKLVAPDEEGGECVCFAIVIKAKIVGHMVINAWKYANLMVILLVK